MYITQHLLTYTTQQELHDNTLTRVVNSRIYNLDLTLLKGIYKGDKSMEHLDKITKLPNEDFIALSEYQWHT